MLSYIILENFKSFKEKTVIDLRKTNYTILPQNVSENEVLKGVTFVGANGSGKSTVLEALKLLLDMMFGEKKIHFQVYKSLLSNRQDFCLEYAFDFLGEEIIYKFSYSIVNDMIHERLYKNESLLYERNGKDARSYFNKEEKIYDEKAIKQDGLFLRTLYFNGQLVHDSILTEWIEFLKNSKYVNASPTMYDFQELTGYYNEYYENGGIQKINEFLEKINYDQRISYVDSAEGDYYQVQSQKKMLFYERQGVHMPVPFVNESLGNRTLIKVLSSYLPVLETGGILLIDEFSSGFHSELERVLIKYFMEKSKSSQLILVSHSTTLLSNSILRPDQEYAIEFDGANGSKIMRFSSMQPRNSQNISKMYLSGVFGGKPIYEEDFEV